MGRPVHFTEHMFFFAAIVNLCNVIQAELNEAATVSDDIIIDDAVAVVRHGSKATVATTSLAIRPRPTMPRAPVPPRRRRTSCSHRLNVVVVTWSGATAHLTQCRMLRLIIHAATLTSFRLMG